MYLARIKGQPVHENLEPGRRKPPRAQKNSIPVFKSLFPFSCLLNLPLLICFGSFGEPMDIGGSPQLPHLTPSSQERNSDWPKLGQVLIPGPITCWRRGGDAQVAACWWGASSCGRGKSFQIEKVMGWADTPKCTSCNNYPNGKNQDYHLLDVFPNSRVHCTY